MDRRIFVLVAAGAALIAVQTGAAGLQAMEPKSLPAPARGSAANSGKVVGILIEKTDKHLMVKAEGSQEAQRFLLAPEGGGAPKADLQATLKTLFVPNLVILESQGQEQPVVTSIHAVLPRTRAGVLIGTVVARESKPREVWLEVKPSGKGFTERYWPRFVGGPDGFDKNMIRTFGELNVGDRVKLAWTYDERKRAAQIQVIAKVKPAGEENEPKADQTP